MAPISSLYPLPEVVRGEWKMVLSASPWIEDFETECRGKGVPEMMEHAEQLKTVDLACFSEKRSYKRDLEFGRTSS
jgi:hypothetical protein